MSTALEITAHRSQWKSRLFVWICRACVALPLFMLGTLIVDVAIDGLGRLDGEFLQSYPSFRAAKAGLWPALVGSLWLIGVTAAIALPLGVGAAVYLQEYGAKNRLSAIIEVNIANLAGVPSVIYGLLGLELFVRSLKFGPTVIAGGCTMALLVLPIVIMASREALRTVPGHLREAGLALGATRWQVVRQVVLPIALPGILTGAILAVSRAIGETAPLILVGAAVYLNFLPEGLRSEFTALPIQIFDWVSKPQEEFLVNAAAGIVVLLATLLLLNSVAIFLRHRSQMRSY